MAMLSDWRWKTAQFVESKWWINYLRNKDPETYLNWKKNHWLSLLDQLHSSIDPQHAKSILDAGCGPAGTFIVLPGNDVTALDPLIETYQEKLPHFNKGMYPEVNFVALPLENFRIDKRFDLIFCMNAINHVSNIKAAIKVLYDHLQIGGKLVMSIDAHNFSLAKRIFQMQPADILHPHQYDLAEYKAMLTDLNLNIIQVYEQKREFLFNHYVLVAQKS